MPAASRSLSASMERDTERIKALIDDDEFPDGALVGDELVHIEEDEDFSEYEEEQDDQEVVGDYAEEISDAIERGIDRDPGVGGWDVASCRPRTVTEIEAIPRVEVLDEDLELSGELLATAVHTTEGNLAILANR